MLPLESTDWAKSTSATGSDAPPAAGQGTMSGYPGTRSSRSTTRRPWSVGMFKLSISGSGRTPTHHTSVREATKLPSLR